MLVFNPHLGFNGNCEEAFNLYKSVFGGELMIMRYKEMPPDACCPIAENERERIMHISLSLGSVCLMGYDSSPSFGNEVKNGDNIMISIHPDNESDAKRIFVALSEGGTIQMPLDKTFFAELYGVFTDRFGVTWAVCWSVCQEDKEQ
jgi:PhnB protein